MTALKDFLIVSAEALGMIGFGVVIVLMAVAAGGGPNV